MGETTTTCGGDLLLPEDILIKTLLYLPVKSLLRFKSVCKSWYSLIQSTFFIDLHTNTNTTSNFGSFIFQTTECLFDDNKLYMLSSGDGDGDGDGDGEYEYYYNEDNDQKKKMVIKLDDLGFSPFYKDFFMREALLHMVGSCNGIVCLQQTGFANFRDVSLCNPATRQFRILPKSIPIEHSHWADDFIGFGFDVKTKDYKVLRITTCEELMEKGECMCRVQVYSLSTDSWRLLDGIDYLPFLASEFAYKNHGIYLNGCYFFLGRNIGSMILSFNFTKEIFTTMQLPDDNSSCVLSYLDDKMAVFTSPRNHDHGGYVYYDIWVLNEQHSNNVGVSKESWTKLHWFQIERTEYSSFKPRCCISNNGEFAIISTGLELINLVTKEAKKDFLIGIQDQHLHKVDVYKESLVSIMGGGNGNVLLKWQHLPTHGTTCYKLNLDAPFIHMTIYFGIGLCLTSDTGDCIRVRSLKRGVGDATEGEALAMLEAIKWAKNLELSPIIIESDSKKCVSFFTDDDDDDNDNSTYWSSRALSLLEEAKLLLLNNSSDEFGGIISFQYCCSKRSCSYVTDVAAKLGREAEYWSCKDWTASNFPGEIIRSLSKDLGLETKEDRVSKRRAKRRAKKEARKRAKEHRKFASQYQDEGIKLFMRAHRSRLTIAFTFLFFFFWYLSQVYPM